MHGETLKFLLCSSFRTFVLLSVSVYVCVCLCFTQHSLLLLGTDKQMCIVKFRPQQVAVSTCSAQLPPQHRLL